MNNKSQQARNAFPWTVFILALALRLFGFFVAPTNLLQWLSQRVELSNVVTSKMRLEECIFYMHHEYPLYEGGLCHHSPLLIYYTFLLRQWIPAVTLSAGWLDSIVYTVMDLLTGLLLYRIAVQANLFPTLFNPTWQLFDSALAESAQASPQKVLSKNSKKAEPSEPSSSDTVEVPQKKSPPKKAKAATGSPQPERKASALDPAELVKETDEFKAHVLDKESVSPSLVAALYLLNPVTLASCLSLSTSLFTTLAVAASFYFACKGKGLSSMLWLAWATYLSFYPWMLLLPLIMVLRKSHVICGRKKRNWLLYLPYFWTFLGSLTFLFAASFLLLHPDQSKWMHVVRSQDPEKLWSLLHSSWTLDGVPPFKQYLYGTFGMILGIQDLSPNVGLYWYFFTEFFDTFRSFFVSMIQLLLASFVLPFAVKFRYDPIFCTSILIGVMSFFKSYPTLGETVFWMSGILPIQSKLLKFQRMPFVAFNVLFFSIILLPFFHFIWIYAGSGNANFFYAITLLWGLGGVWLMNDLVYAWIRRTYEIYIYGHASMGEYRRIDVDLK